VGIDEGAVAIDGANAVAVAVGGKACVIFSGAHRFPQSFDVRLDRFGMHAAETRVARAPNFVASHAVAVEKVRVISPAADPCMGSTTKRNFASRRRCQSISFSMGVQVRCARLQPVNQFLARRQRRHAVRQHAFEFFLNLRRRWRAVRCCRSWPCT